MLEFLGLPGVGRLLEADLDALFWIICKPSFWSWVEDCAILVATIETIF
jgi:hypothetical protein